VGAMRKKKKYFEPTFSRGREKRREGILVLDYLNL
jgi:hypothetical protein